MTLRLLLGDQLNAQHSWFARPDDHVTYLMMEMRQETDYVVHHIQKVVAFFAAMRAFAAARQAEGHRVVYLPLDDPENLHTLEGNLERMLQKGEYDRFEYQLPDEYRLDQQLALICEGLPIPSGAVDSEHFLTHRMELAEMFAEKKTYLMETFYRNMRKKHRIMVDMAQAPWGEKWNFDADNRNRYDGAVPVPAPKGPARQVAGLVRMIREAGVRTLGTVDEASFVWPVTREESLAMLEEFVEERLPWFGTYQDAMSEAHWALFHARLSFPLNVKLLHPMEVVNRAIEQWQDNQETIGLAQLEGFVRQIVGWREYMRGVYWAKMPSYSQENALNHQRTLPGWFWTGETKMNCLRHSIGQSLEFAYAHHIQRLMVTGNFALLAGIHPDEVDAWYLGIYLDAIEWVEMPNTRGMSQYADGGLVGSKPYVSSANYLDKMSDYCGGCSYDKKKRHGANACPFNSLYWHFYHRHADRLQKNPRIGFAYKTLGGMSATELGLTLSQAEQYLQEIESL